MKKSCLHVSLGVPTGSKTDHIPTVNWGWSALFVRMLSKLSKSSQTQRNVYSIKQTLKYSLARNILVVDGHFSVFPSIRINLGSFFRMEHRAHQNPHYRFIFSKKNRYQSLKSTKEATWSSACVMTKESCRSSSIMCRSRKAYKLFFSYTQKKKEIKFYFWIVMKWFKLSRGLFEKHVSFAKASCKKRFFLIIIFFFSKDKL